MLVTATKKTNKKLLIIFGIVFVLAIVFKYYFADKMFGTGDALLEGENLIQEEQTLDESAISGRRVLFKVLDNELFQSLKKIGDWPVEVKEKGRPNPFLKPQTVNP